MPKIKRRPTAPVQQLNAAMRTMVLFRDDMACVRCGEFVRFPDYSLHHRKAKGMGGDRWANRLSNLILLCGSGTTGCHGWVTEHPELAYEAGWSVPRWDGTTEVPVKDARRGWIHLDNDGAWEAAK